MIRSGPKRESALHFDARQLDSGQTILAVPELRRDQLLIQRMLRSAGHRQIASPGERHQLERVLQTLPPVDVAGHDGQRLDFQFGRVQGQQNRHRVIDTRIGINDHAPRRLCQCGDRKTKGYKQNDADTWCENRFIGKVLLRNG